MKQVITCVIGMCCALAMPASAGILENRHARQCVIVTTESWSSPNGTMSIFERAMLDSNWKQHGSRIPVVVGSAGLAWGEGVAMRTRESDEPFKKEGDNKAPAGIFVLHGVFGYAPRAQTKMRYLALSPNIVGVDDPESRYYN